MAMGSEWTQPPEYKRERDPRISAASGSTGLRACPGFDPGMCLRGLSSHTVGVGQLAEHPTQTRAPALAQHVEVRVPVLNALLQPDAQRVARIPEHVCRQPDRNVAAARRVERA